MTKDPRVYLVQIVERLERIESFTRGGRAAFLDDPMVQDAVIHNFEVIGEAAKRVPDDFRAAHPEIPWRELAAFRDVLIHQYEGVSLNEVWSTVEGDLPAVMMAIRAVLPPLDELEAELGDDDSPDLTDKRS